MAICDKFRCSQCKDTITVEDEYKDGITGVEIKISYCPLCGCIITKAKE